MRRAQRGFWLLAWSVLAVSPGKIVLAQGDAPKQEFYYQAVVQDEDYWNFDIYQKFFKEERGADGRPMLVSQRARSRDSRFPKHKPAGALRVFIIGGSAAAQYDPDDGAGSGSGPKLPEILAGVFPGRAVEVINCAMPAYDSYRESLVLAEVLAYEPDVVVLMSGLNESLTAAGPPSLSALALLKLRRIPLLGKWISERTAPASPAPEGRAVGAAFESRLSRMARLAKAKGARVVVCTMPRQLGLPPAAPLPLWDRTFLAAWTDMDLGRIKSAVAGLRRYVGSHPEDEMGRVFLGRALEKLGDIRAARASYVAAREPLSQNNRIIRRVAGEEGAALADLEAAFDATLPGARDDRLFFTEIYWRRDCDPLVSGVIAQALARDAEGLRRNLRTWQQRAAAGAGRSEADFRRRALRAVWESRVEQAGLSERSIAYFGSLRLDYPEELAGLAGRRALLLDSVRSNVWTRAQSAEFDGRWTTGLACLAEAYRRAGRYGPAREYFTAALEREPSAVWPRLGLALSLAAAGRSGPARAELDRIRQPEASLTVIRRYRRALGLPEASRPGSAGGEPLRPGDLDAAVGLAEIALRAGDRKTALSLLSRAETLRAASGPAPAEASMHRLGLLLGELGSSRACVAVMGALVARQPKVAAYSADKGICEYRAGEADAAVKDLERAIELDAGFLPAYLSLGAIYAGQGRRPEALGVYDRALAQRGLQRFETLHESLLEARAETARRAGR
jgi:tetratricopeptide (TPR) repeat protein